MPIWKIALKTNTNPRSCLYDVGVHTILHENVSDSEHKHKSALIYFFLSAPKNGNIYKLTIIFIGCCAIKFLSA
jgi:hypothetical protein